MTGARCDVGAFVESGRLPEHWLDPERAPRWWCDRCTDTNWEDCRQCDGMGLCDSPPSRAALLAVVDIGLSAITRAEAIVGETWRWRVVWRVLPWRRREELACAAMPRLPGKVVRALGELDLCVLSAKYGRVVLCIGRDIGDNR